MTTPGHPPAAHVRRLLDGELDPVAQDALMTHLESCPACLELAAGLSAEESPLTPESVPLDAATSRRIEGMLFRRIHRTTVLEKATGLASRGFFEVVIQLLRPLAALFSTDKK